jgi:hypothetical protein
MDIAGSSGEQELGAAQICIHPQTNTTTSKACMM